VIKICYYLSFFQWNNPVLRSFSITRPDDWHVHCRDHDMLSSIVSATADDFGRALLMPNLLPPLTSVAAIIAYRNRVIASLKKPNAFVPYMTLYINESVSVEELYLARESDFILGAKLYPVGATTNSEHGVRSVSALYPLFEVMQELDLVLQIHGEVTYGDIFDREAQFIEDVLLPLTHHFPRLRIVLEHISTRAAVEFVEQASPFVAATITPHHLFYNRNQLLAGGIRPHYYCLPILKHEHDQAAVQRAAVSCNGKFFAGTDSAPHLRNRKESSCGCAGIFSAPYALAIYAEVFDNLGKLKQLEPFMSQYGADFYKLPMNQGQVELIQRSQHVPDVLEYDFGQIVPIGAGTVLRWSVNERT